MRNALWLFFDLGNTLVNEETAAECRIQRLVEALARYRRRCSFDEVQSAFQQASAEFAPHLFTRAIGIGAGEVQPVAGRDDWRPA